MNKRPRSSDDLFGFGEGWNPAAPPKRPPSLFELTTRAMTREQLSQVSPSQFPKSAVEPLLAMTNRLLKKAVRKLIILLNAAKTVPGYIAGVPRAAWHTLNELTPGVTDDDLSRGLYRHIQYRFLPRGDLAQSRPYSLPFRILDLSAPDAANRRRVTLRYGYTQQGATHWFTQDYLIDSSDVLGFIHASETMNFQALG
jgi:hypothetical protein